MTNRNLHRTPLAPFLHDSTHTFYTHRLPPTSSPASLSSQPYPWMNILGSVPRPTRQLGTMVPRTGDYCCCYSTTTSPKPCRLSLLSKGKPGWLKLISHTFLFLLVSLLPPPSVCNPPSLSRCAYVASEKWEEDLAHVINVIAAHFHLLAHGLVITSCFPFFILAPKRHEGRCTISYPYCRDGAVTATSTTALPLRSPFDHGPNVLANTQLTAMSGSLLRYPWPDSPDGHRGSGSILLPLL